VNLQKINKKLKSRLHKNDSFISVIKKFVGGRTMVKLRKKVIGLTIAGTVAVGSLVIGNSIMDHPAQAKSETKKKGKHPENVIMMVMDGTSSTATTLARWYKGEPLAMDEIMTGGVRTYSAESAITDSAPAGASNRKQIQFWLCWGVAFTRYITWFRTNQ
jgi:alkaline phosphatase